jgi:transposase
MQIATIGIDIGKSSFHIVGLNVRGEIVLRRRCTRKQLMRDLANLPPCLVGMEACCGAHHLGQRLVTPWPHRASHPAAMRQAVREIAEE